MSTTASSCFKPVWALSVNVNGSELIAGPCRNRNTLAALCTVYWWSTNVLFLVAGVFVSGGRDGSIMVWDTRCSTKGNSVQVYGLHSFADYYLCHVRYVMITLISEILSQDFYQVTSPYIYVNQWVKTHADPLYIMNTWDQIPFIILALVCSVNLILWSDTRDNQLHKVSTCTCKWYIITCKKETRGWLYLN